MNNNVETMKYVLRHLKAMNTGVGAIAACVAALEDAIEAQPRHFDTIREIQSRINSSMINGKEEAAGALRELFDAVASKSQHTWDENPYPCQLKECPFCGNHHVPRLLIHSCAQYHEHWVWCPACNAQGPEETTEIEAINSWNRRAE